jgi:hypothetical protein
VITLIREEFAKWLDGYGDSSFVGAPTLPCECPIALFLSCKVGYQRVLVTDGFYGGAGIKRQPLPQWACEFIRRFDQLLDPRALHARAILKAIPL